MKLTITCTFITGNLQLVPKVLWLVSFPSSRCSLLRRPVVFLSGITVLVFSTQVTSHLFLFLGVLSTSFSRLSVRSDIQLLKFIHMYSGMSSYLSLPNWEMNLFILWIFKTSGACSLPLNGAPRVVPIPWRYPWELGWKCDARRVFKIKIKVQQGRVIRLLNLLIFSLCYNCSIVGNIYRLHE